MQEKLLPLDYIELRTAVHKILNELLDREFECAQTNEFDYEYFEAKTDDILRLIKRQNQNN